MTTLFTGKCCRCWPGFCRCPPTTDEVEQMKGDAFLIDRELQRENRRAREFGDALKQLSQAVITARETRMADGGFDNVPADLHDLFTQAQAATALLSEDRNQDRVAPLYRAMQHNDGGAVYE
ncbi:hypothetical protein [Achromobacter denitrificans]|uniref:hypothetical protein n=1 Tax=Achromobacter denitrificans TaxID=32002 RepID=UPI003BA1D44F